MSHASSVGDIDDNERRHRMAFETFVDTMSLIHTQIASINDRLDKQERQQPTPVISHRGYGSLPIASPTAVSPTGAPGDPVARYDDARGEWAAGLLKVMREERN